MLISLPLNKACKFINSVTLPPILLTKQKFRAYRRAAIATYSQSIFISSCTPAWWILIPAVNFEFWEQFSPQTAQGITDAVAQIQQIILK